MMDRDAESVRFDNRSACETELSAEEQVIVSRYPPASTLEPEANGIRAAAERLKPNPEQAKLQTAYGEAVEFAKYWAEIYEDLRLHGVRALEDYYNDTDFGEVDSTLEALDAVLWALGVDIVRSRRDQRAMELKFGLKHSPGWALKSVQMDLFGSNGATTPEALFHIQEVRGHSIICRGPTSLSRTQEGNE
ncbi:MAG: hypothetical protein ACRD2G_16715 [Terriglobia bacterium]